MRIDTGIFREKSVHTYQWLLWWHWWNTLNQQMTMDQVRSLDGVFCGDTWLIPRHPLPTCYIYSEVCCRSYCNVFSGWRARRTPRHWRRLPPAACKWPLMWLRGPSSYSAEPAFLVYSSCKMFTVNCWSCFICVMWFSVLRSFCSWGMRHDK